MSAAMLCIARYARRVVQPGSHSTILASMSRADSGWRRRAGSCAGLQGRPVQDLGRVFGVQQGCLEFRCERPEDAVGAEGGFASGGVAVEGGEDAGAVQVGGLADEFGLLAGQGGAARGEPGVPAGVGGGDRDGVERSFHDDGRGPWASAGRAWCRPNSRLPFL